MQFPLKVAIGCVFFLIQAFLILQTQAEFRDEDINWTRFGEHAEWVSEVLTKSDQLMITAPKTVKLIKDLATNVKNVVAKVSPDFAVATLYFTAVVAVSYYYSVEAQQQLLKAHFKKDELKNVIDAEIIPILAFLEKLPKEDVGSFCRAKSEIETRFENSLTCLQAIRKNFEQQMLESRSSAERNKFLQILCTAGGVASIVAMPTGFPIAGLVGLSSSITGFGFGYTTRMTLEKTMELLNVTRLEALKVEKVCKKATTDAELFCIEHPPFPEKQLESLKEAYMSIKIMKERFQLEDQSKENKPELSNEL